MSKDAIRVTMKIPHTHNLHVPFPHALYKELRAESKRRHLPTTKLVREAVKLWLAQQKATSLDKAVTKYAVEYAGTEFDFDKNLERASVGFIIDEQEKK